MKPDFTRTHIAPNGDVYIQEFYSAGSAAWEIVRNPLGQQIDTSGSGGQRPWDKHGNCNLAGITP